MSEEQKATYKKIPSALKIPIILRVKEIKSLKEENEYKGFTADEIMEAAKKLDENLTKKQFNKFMRESLASGSISPSGIIDVKDKKRTYNVSSESVENIDDILHCYGWVETTVRLNIDL